MAAIPEEVLAEIFAHLGPKKALYKSWDPLSLSFVCKRWNRIYERLLYREIDLGHSGWKEGPRIRQLLQNLLDRPDIRVYVKAIGIQLYRHCQNTCRNVARVVELCTATRSVALHTKLSEPSLPLLHAVANLPLLESLRLTGYAGGPSIYTVLRFFDLKRLKNLELSRYGVGKGANLGASWPLDFPTTQHDLEQLLPPRRYHTGSVTSLVLSDPSTSLRVSEHLLRWPERLERLTFSSLIRSSFAREYTPNDMERLLGLHRQSLKFIQIGIIPSMHLAMPDFSSFECLEELHMSAYQLLSETPSNAMSKLAAPCLHHLSASFSTEDLHTESHNAFSAEQVRWMADFAQLKTKEYAVSRLATICIDFNQDDSLFWWNDFDQDVTWPWDYLDEAAQILAQHGLALTYSTPSLGSAADHPIQLLSGYNPDAYISIQSGL